MASPKKIGTHNAVSHRLVDPNELILNPENERDYAVMDAHMVALRQSIMSEGVLSPLEIYDDGTVADGNRRLFNIQILLKEGTDIGPVPAIIIPRPTKAEDAVFHRLNRNEAQQFSPLEQGRAFAKLRDLGLNNSQIAARSPFTSMHVGNMLTLHDLSDDTKALVREGRISATLAVEAARKHGEDILAKAVNLAEAEDRDRATQRHIDAVLPAPVVPVAAVPMAEATADASVAEATAEPVGEATAEPVGEAETAATAEATAEPVGEAISEDESAVGAATADDTAPFAVSDAVPPAPVATGAEEITTTTTGTTTSTTNATSFNPKALVQMIAPTLNSLYEAMEGGTLKEKSEALNDAGDDLRLFLTHAKKLGLFD